MDALVLKVLNHYNDHKPNKLSKLKGDASSREYYRDQKNNLIICHYHNDKQGFDNFVSLQKILDKNKIKAPKVLHASFPILIQEDLGDISLNLKITEENYLKVIETLIDWQKLPTKFEYKESEKKFNVEKFLWELNFGQKHLDELIKKEQTFDLQDDFKSICEDIVNETNCPTHRDFHSKNLMVYNNDIVVIDFQDARTGPFLYDLVSLIEDPYVELSESYKIKLKKEFINLNTLAVSDFESLYKKTLIQRLFKACGSFASQKNLKGTDEYLKYLKPALTNLSKNLESSEYSKLKTYIDLNLELWTNLENN